MKWSPLNRSAIFALCVAMFATARAQAQFAEVPTVYGDPSANCYNRSAVAAGNNVAFSWTRIDMSSACDTNADGWKQLFLIYRLTPQGAETDPLPTPFGLALGKSVTVSLPSAGVYEVLG